jgi:recombination protein RecT
MQEMRAASSPNRTLAKVDRTPSHVQGEVMTDLGTALEVAKQPHEAKTILSLIERQKPELEKALAGTIGVERFTRTILTELRRTPTLYECSPESLLGAMMLAAQLQLEPGPLGLVYLVPFKRQVEFIVGYRGYVELAFRSGLVKDVSASLVYEGDEFEYREGTRPFLDHIPDFPYAESREIIAAYAVARLKTGGAPFKVIYEPDWQRAKSKSPAGSRGVGPWVEDFPQMVLKTAIRRLEPKLPKTPQFGLALEADEAAAPVFEDASPETDSEPA